MKKILYFLILTFSIISLISCESDDEGNSVISKPAVIELNGDETVYVVKGLSYTEDGVNVTGGTLYKTVGMVAIDRAGSYTIQYIAKNPEGAFSSIKRTVIVLELGDGSIDLSGTYAGYRGDNYGTDIVLTQIATGVYTVTDMFGGFYEYYREYGSAYRAPGIIRYEGDGIVTMPVWASSPWGTFNFLGEEGTVAVDGTISYKILFDDETSIATAFKLVKK